MPVPTSKEIKYILVSDIDACLHTSCTNRLDLLSEGLINHVQAGAIVEGSSKRIKYAGAYACTHRAYFTALMSSLNVERVTYIRNSFKKHSQLTDKLDSRNLLTSRIIKNFEDATGLQCFAVSTPDDGGQVSLKEKHEKCGVGFKKFIKPLEDAILKKIENKNLNDEEIYKLAYQLQSEFLVRFMEDEFSGQPVESFDASSKNSQLKDIAFHAAHIYPHHTIILDYVDDQKDLCEQAQRISILHLPPNVKVRVGHHNSSVSPLVIPMLEPQKLDLASQPSTRPLGILSFLYDFVYSFQSNHAKEEKRADYRSSIMKTAVDVMKKDIQAPKHETVKGKTDLFFHPSVQPAEKKKEGRVYHFRFGTYYLK